MEHKSDVINLGSLIELLGNCILSPSGLLRDVPVNLLCKLWKFVHLCSFVKLGSERLSRAISYKRGPENARDARLNSCLLPEVITTLVGKALGRNFSKRVEQSYGSNSSTSRAPFFPQNFFFSSPFTCTKIFVAFRAFRPSENKQYL